MLGESSLAWQVVFYNSREGDFSGQQEMLATMKY